MKCYRKWKIGMKIQTIMGVRLKGKVISRKLKRSEYTDGSYREPEKYERVIFIEWEDGSKGWAHEVHICKADAITVEPLNLFNVLGESN